MSQSSGSYHQPPYSETLKDINQPIPPSSGNFINGQTNMPHIPNGTQPPISFNPTGTPSSQSSRDPSRETSRDPSPTQYLHNQYRPQLTRPPMAPINGQQQQPQMMPPRPFVPPLQRQQIPNQPPSVTNVPQVGKNINDNQPIQNPSLQNNSAHRTSAAIHPPHVIPQNNQIWNNQTNMEKNPTQLETTGLNTKTIAGHSQFSQQQYQQNSTTQSIKSPSQMPNLGPQRSFPGPPVVPQISSQPQLPAQGQFKPQQNEIVSNQLTNQQVRPLAGQSHPLNQNLIGRQANLASQNMYTQPAFPGQLPPEPPKNNFEAVPLTTPGQQQQQYPMRTMPHTSVAPPPLPGQIQNPAQIQKSQFDANNRQYYGQMSNIPLDNMPKRYPPSYTHSNDINQMNTQMQSLNVTQSGFNELWGNQTVDLLQCRNILPAEGVEPPRIKLQQEFQDSVNCSPDIFRCTLTKIPESHSLLQKCRLPLGVLIHPFKDLNHLPVIQCSTIVRCRACRTYINPFVYFVDSKRWKCNLCYRINELPEEFQFDPVTKVFGDPSRRPEVKTSTIEFIAPSEYMLRPPQPAVYLFILDVSRLAVESGYLSVVCTTISEELLKLPGDSRTQVGFLAVDSAVHFFSMPDNVSQPHELIMLDVDDVFLPCPDNLIVNLKECEELIRDLLNQLPMKFVGTHDTNSALGAGLEAAFKLMSATGGRVTVFQTCLPNIGPGALQPREDPNGRANKEVPHLNPATDFYKRLALNCSGQQIAVDLFLLNSQYSDLATLSGMCKFSGGCIYHLPLFRIDKPQHGETLEKMLRRYLTRKIGFEAVMRIRCTRGLSIHTFHGNFFVRSTDLLSLPNVNPDAGFGMQVSIDENLSDVQTVCFQAALLYTSSKGERRIRVHTLCLPVSSSISEILYSADQQCIIGLLSKMAVDRSGQSSLSDARDALINVAIDVLTTFKVSQSAMSGGLMAPGNLKLLPMYIIALLKSVAFRIGQSTRLDDRVAAMCQMKTLPLFQMMQVVYPDLYPVHMLDGVNVKNIDGKMCPQPSRMHLSAEKLDFRGVFLMDTCDKIIIYVGKNVDPIYCTNVFGVSAYGSIPEEMYELPELDTVESERLRNFVFSLQEEKPYYATVQIIRDDSHHKALFTERLIEDRLEAALSYYEFLQHLKTQIK